MRVRWGGWAPLRSLRRGVYAGAAPRNCVIAWVQKELGRVQEEAPARQSVARFEGIAEARARVCTDSYGTRFEAAVMCMCASTHTHLSCAERRHRRDEPIERPLFRSHMLLPVLFGTLEPG